jgi:hypothetical protein
MGERRKQKGESRKVKAESLGAAQAFCWKIVSLRAERHGNLRYWSKL